MLLTLIRREAIGPATLGELYVDGAHCCYTLEDRVRTGPKVPGDTAIPAGRYPVEITRSARFGRDLPLLRGVPNFTGVRIHCGNTTADTEGCILVGLAMDLDAGTIQRSRAALSELQPQIRAALDSGEPVTIEIREEWTNAEAPVVAPAPADPGFEF